MLRKKQGYDIKTIDLCNANSFNLTNMKQKVFLVCAAIILGAIFASSNALCVNKLHRDEHQAILIHQRPNQQPDAPRSSTTIEAFLDTEMFTIDVYLRNAGESVTVDIENTTTGSTYQYSVSGNGSDVLPISSTSGFWTITFTLADGRVYYGEFII